MLHAEGTRKRARQLFDPQRRPDVDVCNVEATRADVSSPVPTGPCRERASERASAAQACVCAHRRVTALHARFDDTCTLLCALLTQRRTRPCVRARTECRRVSVRESLGSHHPSPVSPPRGEGTATHACALARLAYSANPWRASDLVRRPAFKRLSLSHVITLGSRGIPLIPRHSLRVRSRRNVALRDVLM